MYLKITLLFLFLFSFDAHSEPPDIFTSVGVTASSRSQGFELSLLGPFRPIPPIAVGVGIAGGTYKKGEDSYSYAEGQLMAASIVFGSIGGGPVYRMSDVQIGFQTTVAAGLTFGLWECANVFPYYRHNALTETDELGLMIKILPYSFKKSIEDLKTARLEKLEKERVITEKKRVLESSGKYLFSHYKLFNRTQGQYYWEKLVKL